VRRRAAFLARYTVARKPDADRRTHTEHLSD
jgi:hypothetical protein